MLKTLFTLLLSISITICFSQNSNIELIYNDNISEDCNDIWGFVDSSGTEYAVIGTITETRIYNLKDPANAQLVYRAPGARSLWRDIKYWNNHLYVTHDQDTFGITIIDVSKAPDTFSHIQYKPSLTIGGSTNRLLRAHNLYIDEKGFAYIAGHNISRKGVLILDLNQDPDMPVYMGAANSFYSHDAFVRNDTLYSSELGAGFGIYDVTDKTNPIEIARGKSGHNFTHNAWLSTDGKVLFTTDEVASGYLESYDISNLSNIRYLDRYKTNPGNTRVIPHNTHILGDFAITSWYTDGVIINDVSDPSNLVKVGSYDTYPQNVPASGTLYLGDWGAYPFLPSGLILVSDINNGLFVLKPTYVHAAYLTGYNFSEINEVKDSLSGVTVKVLGTDIEKFSNGTSYKIGLTPEQDYNVVFTHPDFGADTVQIKLAAGETAQLDHTFYQTLTSLDEKHIQQEVFLFPNPVHSEIIVAGLEGKNYTYQIFAATGQLMREGKSTSNGTIEVGSLSSGTYSLNIRINNAAPITKYFVKQ